MADNSAMFKETHQNRLRQYRTERGLSQQALAKSLGVGQPTLSRWERGARCPSADLQEAAARVLGVSAARLFPSSLIPEARR